MHILRNWFIIGKQVAERIKFWSRIISCRSIPLSGKITYMARSPFQ